MGEKNGKALKNRSFADVYQTSANQDPNSRFVLEANIKALISNSSWSSILKISNCLHPIHDFQPTRICPNTLIPTSAYTISYLNKHLFALNASLFVFSKKFDQLTNNNLSHRHKKGRLSSYFGITMPGRVIPRSLMTCLHLKEEISKYCSKSCVQYSIIDCIVLWINPRSQLILFWLYVYKMNE